MKIVWLSDFDMRGSGYFNISVPLCSELVAIGHEIKAIGLGYLGTEHNYPISIIPCQTLGMALQQIELLYNMWKFDILVVALDIAWQEDLVAQMQNRPFKYVGIMPIEAPPLCMTWAISLMGMDKAFIISRFGLEEAQKAGVYISDYLHVGLELDKYIHPSPQEKVAYRNLFGIDKDEFVILTVADNQERKNLSAAIMAYKKFLDIHPNSRYVLVTRVNQKVGWKIDDIASEYGILQKLIKIERGIPQDDLIRIYSIADAFLLTSKAEGLGMPMLEAMAMGIPCIGTDCTAIHEHLQDGRGILIDPIYNYRDPFGNGYRYFVDTDKVVAGLKFILDDDESIEKIVKRAMDYVSDRTWDSAVEKLDRCFTEITRNDNNEQK